MFKSLKRIVYPVVDLEKAKEWYTRILGAPPLFDSPTAAIFKVGECSLSLAKSDAPPDAAKSVETFWEVNDIEDSFKRLVDAGAHVRTPVKNVLNISIAQVIDPFGNVIGITGLPPGHQKRTVELHPSETAQNVAFCRALAAKEERVDIRGGDHLAELFINDDAQRALKDSTSRKWSIQNVVSSALYGYFIARTAFFDQIFQQALAEQIPQIVFLGAGYDTRAYRSHESIGQSRIFELDTSWTQRRKLEILNRAQVHIPPQVTFVEINFKIDRLEEVLHRAGFADGVKTLFIWEGVTYYLTHFDIHTTLRIIKKYSPAGSIVAFDYMTEKLDSVNAAEPFQFWVKKEDIRSLLEGHGIKLVEHIEAEEMEKRWLTLADGTLAEKSLPQFCLARGMVTD